MGESDPNVQKLNEYLEGNPYDYDSHLKRIELTRGDVLECRKYRKNFHQYYSLSPQLWLEWLKDEIDVLPKEDMIELILQSLQDFSSIELYQYLLTYLEDQEFDTEYKRTLLKQAVSHTQYHFKSSHLIWNQYIQFEVDHLEPTKIHQLFHNRFNVPHQGIEETKSIYSSFCSTVDPDDYISRMKQVSIQCSETLKLSQKREQFEAQLISQDHSVESFLKYIEYEKSCRQEGFVKCLYERAMEHHSYHSGLWVSYLSYLGTVHSPKTILEQQVKRGMKNSFECLTNVDLWEYRIKLATTDVERVFEHALWFVSHGTASITDGKTAISVIIKARLTVALEANRVSSEADKETTIQELKKVIQKVVKMVKEGKGDENVVGFAAFILGHHLRDTEGAYSIYTDLLMSHTGKDKKKGENMNVLFSKEMIDGLYEQYSKLCIQLGDLEKARGVFKDWSKRPSVKASKAWLPFEECYGHIDEWWSAKDRFLEIKAKEQIQHTQEDLPMDIDVNMLPEQSEENGKRKRQPPNDVEPESDSSKKIKTENEIGDISTYKIVDKMNAGQMIFLGDLPYSTTTDHLLQLFQRYGRITDCVIEPNEEGNLEGLVEFFNTESVKQAVMGGSVSIADTKVTPIRCRPTTMKWNFQNEKKKDTVYVSNLSPTINKMMLRATFGSIAKVKDIRVSYKPRYAFAYIQFHKEEDAIHACSLDQTQLDGRPIGVAISDPSKKTVHEIDESLLYVSNLPTSVLEPDLQDLFKQFGEIKQIRLYTGAKPFGYIHFAKKEDAKNAISLNGSMLDNRVILVTVADPNVRTTHFKTKPKKDVVFVPKNVKASTGPKSKLGISHNDAVNVKASTGPKSKLGISHNDAVNVKASTGPKSKLGESQNDTTDKKILDTQKTQDDFRKMLLGKK